VKILVVYNRYRHRVHGEEVVVDSQLRLLREHGIDVSLHVRSSEGLEDAGWKKLVAGMASIYNPASRRRLSQEIATLRPDVIHVHNLYPWVSPSALIAAKRAGVPVVMTIHHYGLTCPVLTHFRAGRPCTDCITASEFSCVRHNCRGSVAESSLYALRTAVARRMRWFMDNVSVFIALSDFSRRQLVSAGFPADRIVVRPNMLNPLTGEAANPGRSSGDYIAYVGRITFEKGVDLLCDAATQANLPLRVAGDVCGWPELPAKYANAIEFAGILRDEALLAFYRNARFIVVPSRWWEVCPLVVLEAMHLGVPVLAARSGGLPEMIEDEISGLLFESGNVGALVNQMQRLWNDAPLRSRLVAAARIRVAEKYSTAPYICDLISIYSRARENSAGKDGPVLGKRRATVLNDCS
jgi:glycosyltransferase involved in cell wall biosynthesis